MKNPKDQTSWEDSAKWYDQAVGEAGHYYHKAVIFPNLLRLMDVENHPSARVLDLGCGQGVFSRQIPRSVDYTGVDLSESLIQSATQGTPKKMRRFLVADATAPLELPSSFSHCVMILSLQNMENQEGAIRNVARHLIPGGRVFLVLNHPCYRIPRQSSWHVDAGSKQRTRQINRYLSPLKIPISTHPGKQGNNQTTWSFHHPLQDYFRWLFSSGLVTETLEEWVSDKRSTNSGTIARMENLSRLEFPLFLCIVARKTES